MNYSETYGTPTSGHCTSISGDRRLGEWGEKQFCRVAAACGKLFTPHQIGRSQSAACAYYQQGNSIHPLLLPDATIWSAPGEHHEIKTKTPTASGFFGLERYRFEALKRFRDECRQNVFYTILNWSRVGKFAPLTVADDWITISIASMEALIEAGLVRSSLGSSWRAGRKQETEIIYWPAVFWDPLSVYWRCDRPKEGL